MKSSKKKKGLRAKVNFDGTSTFAKIPDGQYPAKVVDIKEEEGDAAPYWRWRFEITDGKLKGASPMPYNTSFAPKALWNLRSLLETLGVEIPEGETELDASDYVDLPLMIRVENEVWEGKERAKVSDFSPIESESAKASADDGEEEDEKEEGEGEEESDDEEEEDEEGEEESEDDDDDGKLSAEEVREMDAKELADVVKKYKLAVDLDKIPKAGKRVAKVIDALEAKDLLK